MTRCQFLDADHIGHVLSIDWREYLAAYMSGNAAEAYFHASFMTAPSALVHLSP